jgi:MFS family permease
MIAVLRQRDFLLAWCGGFLALTGNWVMFIALPIYIYELTDSAVATSGIFLVRLIPGIVLSSLAGAYVDRWDRKRTLVIANLGQLVVVLPVLLVTSEAWLPLLLVFAGVQSTLNRFIEPAENALLPRLVQEDELVTANALNALNNNLARLLGPAIGGSIVALYGLRAAVVIDVVCFGLTALLVSLIATSGRVQRSNEPGERHESIWSEWRAGLGFIRRRRAVSTLLGLESIGYLGEGVMSVMFVVWVADVLGGGAREMGWLMSGQAVGGLVGGALLGTVAGRLVPVRLLGYGGLLFGATDLVLFNYPRFFDAVWLGVVIIAIVGLPIVAYATVMTTLLQQSVEDAFRGRVFGVMATLGSCLQLIGTLLAGLLGGLLGPLTLLNIQGGSYMLVGALALILLPRAIARDAAGSGDGPVAEMAEQERQVERVA